MWWLWVRFETHAAHSYTTEGKPGTMRAVWGLTRGEVHFWIPGLWTWAMPHCWQMRRAALAAENRLGKRQNKKGVCVQWELSRFREDSPEAAVGSSLVRRGAWLHAEAAFVLPQGWPAWMTNKAIDPHLAAQDPHFDLQKDVHMQVSLNRITGA